MICRGSRLSRRKNAKLPARRVPSKQPFKISKRIWAVASI